MAEPAHEQAGARAPGPEVPEAGEAAVEGLLSSGVEVTFAMKLKRYGLIALVSVATLLLSSQGPQWVIPGGAATSAVYLFGFRRCNPRYVGLLLIGLALFGYVALPMAPVYWMMGCAVGGGVAALLTTRDHEEDDQFFLPPLAALLFTFIFFTLGRPGGWAESLRIVDNYIDSYNTFFMATLELPENEQLRSDFTSQPSWETVHPYLGLIAFSFFGGVWFLLMWLFNRVARRRLGAIKSIFQSIMLFRVRPPYLFLLIAALILEILAAWLEREGLHNVSFPLLAVCGTAFIMVHVGIVLFIAAVRRLSSPEGLPVFMLVLVLLGLAFAFYIGPVVGLADVWFDFRKTKLIKDRLG